MLLDRDCIYMLAAGFLLDLIIGDPEGIFHIVRLSGGEISVLEKLLYRKGRPSREFLRGLILVVICLLSATALSFFLLYFISKLSRIAGVIFGALLSWQCLAIKCLKVSSMKVYDALKREDGLSGAEAELSQSGVELANARRELSMIVGRDTDRLDRAGIIRAAVESVAESSSDGIIAPLFYLFLFGPVGGVIYKTVNTMDSMLGYRNERYEYFGKAAARLDDILNFIPSRLTALFMITAAFIHTSFSGRGALKVWLRDRNLLKSPNAGQTEAAASGALSLRLAGPAYYKGVLSDKPFIGAEFERESVPGDIKRINNLMYLTSFLAFFTGLFFSIPTICN
ncbi:MAG: cobalamin biosynthesis protein CobD [Lachnospiraceae bacterium]|nr:cobalamin biosynthesis protein CobD [Lachnospiraceae bacterium]